MQKSLERLKNERNNLSVGESTLRGRILGLYLINFLVGLAAMFLIPQEIWKGMDVWQIALQVYYILLGFFGVLIAYCVWKDGRDIELLKKKLKLQRVESS